MRSHLYSPGLDDPFTSFIPMEVTSGVTEWYWQWLSIRGRGKGDLSTLEDHQRFVPASLELSEPAGPAALCWPPRFTYIP